MQAMLFLSRVSELQIQIYYENQQFFWKWGHVSAFNESQFSAFIQFLKKECHEMPIRKAACTIGQQPCLKEWVLGKYIIVGEDGKLIPLGQSRYIWLHRVLLGGTGNVLSQDVIPCSYLHSTCQFWSHQTSLPHETGTKAQLYQWLIGCCWGSDDIALFHPDNHFRWLSICCRHWSSRGRKNNSNKSSSVHHRYVNIITKPKLPGSVTFVLLL